ncbi:MAG: PRD domain-containing protein [Lactobacillus sp.]|nr:PRD domain-containing protein [Lactobacillus sp.]
MFRIKKIFNVNVVLAEEDGQEYIVFGKGVGYHQKINNLLPNSSVVKKFIPVNDSRKIEMIQSLNKIPPIYIDITTKIVEYAEKVLRESLLSSVYYSLTDHLYFAVQRYNSHQALGNRIYWEMKTYYPEMFDIGEYGLDVIKETLKISLPKEEAANIAFHIINASTKSSDKVNILDVTQLVDNMEQALRVLTGDSISVNALNYNRFITHLKFFAERFFSNSMLDDDNDELINKVYELYPEASRLAIKIQQTIISIYQQDITKTELAYLIIHIHRLLTN